MFRRTLATTENYAISTCLRRLVVEKSQNVRRRLEAPSDSGHKPKTRNVVKIVTHPIEQPIEALWCMTFSADTTLPW